MTRNYVTTHRVNSNNNSLSLFKAEFNIGLGCVCYCILHVNIETLFYLSITNVNIIDLVLSYGTTKCIAISSFLVTKNSRIIYVYQHYFKIQATLQISPKFVHNFTVKFYQQILQSYLEDFA